MMLTTQILLLFLLCGPFTSTVDAEILDNHISVIRTDVSKLTKFIIANFTEETYILCILHCAENHFCAAVNYKEKAEGNEPNCQLTNSTEQELDENASEKEKVWTFRKVIKDRAFLDCSGAVNECQNGGTMIWDPVKPFICICSKGFQGEHCENDIDECSHKSKNACDPKANCTNTDGSYVCQCQSGYIGDGKNCSDIDECSDESSNTCDPNANCINTHGSYVCQCQSGYIGDGKTCSVHVLDSVILKSVPQEFTNKLGVWLPKTGNWKTCWRASRDGWDVTTTFHPDCDGKIPTLTIVKVVKNGKNYIFGGYCTEKWGGNNGWTSAPGSFLFSLRNNDNLPPFKGLLINQNGGSAIYRNSDLGPAFGAGADLRIDSNANTNTNSYTYFGHTYQAPAGYSYGSTNTNALLAGSNRFTPSEVEVLYLPA